MLRETEAIIKKNLKRLIRSKLSALIIVLGPLFMILLVGIAFDNSELYGIKIGLYAKDYDNVVNSLIQSLEDKEFKVIEKDTPEACIKEVKEGLTHLCITVPEEEDEQRKLQFYVDYSRLNLVQTLINTISAGVNRQSAEISMDITEDLLKTLEETSDNIRNGSNEIDNFRNNIEMMGAKVTSIENDVNSLNISFDFGRMNVTGMKKSINESKEETSAMGAGANRGINDYEEKLDDLDDKVSILEKDLDYNADQIEEVKNNINSTYSKLGCISKEDVFAGKDAEEIAAMITASDSPECAMLYSVWKVIDERTNIVGEAKKEVDQMQEDIDSARDDLDSAEDSIDDTISNTNSRFTAAENQLSDIERSLESAKRKVEEANRMKMSLAGELVNMKSALSNSTAEIEKLKEGLDSISDAIDAVAVVSPEAVIKPISSQIKPIVKDKKVLDYIFPSLIVLVITFTSILLSSTIIMKEKSSPAYFRNFITPASNALFIIGTYLSALLVVLVQCIILIVVGLLFFRIRMGLNIIPVIAVLIPIASVFIFIGMIMGQLFKSEETTTLASISLSCVLFLFSSMVVPIENMREGIGQAAMANPFVMSEMILKQLIVFGSDFSPIALQVGFLILYLAVLFSLMLITRVITRHFIER